MATTLAMEQYCIGEATATGSIEKGALSKTNNHLLKERERGDRGDRWRVSSICRQAGKVLVSLAVRRV